MTGNTPDFVAIGGPTSPATFAALTAVRLGRSAGVLVADTLPAYERETLVSVGVEVAFGPPQLRAEHIPWSWLDAEIVLAAQSDDEVDSAMLGRFGRSLIGLIARGSEAAGHQPSPLAPGAGALFFAEPDAQTGRIAAPIALSLGLTAGLRLWWQGAWRDIASDPRARREANPPVLAATAAAFLVRLTETRDAVTASGFAAATAALLPPTPRFSLEDIPTREAIAAAL